MNSSDRGDWLAHLAALPNGRPLPAFAGAITNRLVYQEREYLDVLCNSRLTLAPAGDQPWSRRVYEAVACCSIPIVHRREHVGRTDDDLDVGYFVHLYDPAAPAGAYAYDRAAATCVEINHWFGGSPPNFRTLYLGQIEVDSADFWTDRLLSSSSRSTAESLASKRSYTLTLKSG